LVFNQIGNGTYITLAAQLGKINADHGDHFAIREALAEFQGIYDKKYFSERQGFGHKVYLTQEEVFKKRQALNNYLVWNPRKGRYAIGEHSVANLLDFWRFNRVEYVFDETELLPQAIE
jgi:hypothetical protein